MTTSCALPPGRVSIDGQGHRTITQPSPRETIGIVPQDTVLFKHTIECNIAYGRAGAGRAEVDGAARDTHIHAFITSTQTGYDTTTGERELKRFREPG